MAIRAADDFSAMGTGLGAFYLPFAESGSGAAVFGAGVAGTAFRQTLLRHGRFDRMEFFAPAGGR